VLVFVKHADRRALLGNQCKQHADRWLFCFRWKLYEARRWAS